MPKEFCLLSSRQFSPHIQLETSLIPPTHWLQVADPTSLVVKYMIAYSVIQYIERKIKVTII